MKFMVKLRVIVLFSVSVLLALGFQQMPSMNAEKATVQIEMEHVVGDALLQLDSAMYKNTLEQSFTVSKFKYYIGNIHLKKADGTEYVSTEYFLVDEEEAVTKQIALHNVPAGVYQALSFTLGVDSALNCSGLQRGALDPINAMFWAWNTGYIFLKLEGYAAASRSPGHFFEYHIGGFRSPNNAIRKITLPLSDLKVDAAQPTALTIQADVAEIFQTPTKVDFTMMSAVTDFHNATMIADNYADMFRVK